MPNLPMFLYLFVVAICVLLIGAMIVSFMPAATAIAVVLGLAGKLLLIASGVMFLIYVVKAIFS